MRYLIPAILALALLVPSAPAEPTATTSVSVRVAKKWIRERMREKFYVRPGSIVISNCRHGYTKSGRHRVLCDTYFEEQDTFRAYCGWGRVVTYRTFYA